MTLGSHWPQLPYTHPKGRLNGHILSGSENDIRVVCLSLGLE